MATVTPDTQIKLKVISAWQGLIGCVVITASVLGYINKIESDRIARDNQRERTDTEFRHSLLDQMRGFVTYSSFNDWVDTLERKNPSLVLPRIRQAAAAEPTKKSFQAATKGNSYAY